MDSNIEFRCDLDRRKMMIALYITDIEYFFPSDSSYLQTTKHITDNSAPQTSISPEMVRDLNDFFCEQPRLSVRE
jgi:hypothetical protein